MRGREAELTEPAALYTGLGVLPGPVLPAVIDAVTPDSPAAAAGLKAGDEVVAIGDKPIRSWDQWVNQIKQRPGETVDITVRRDGKRANLHRRDRHRRRRAARRSAASVLRGRARCRPG